jgi:hypothetical protein
MKPAVFYCGVVESDKNTQQMGKNETVTIPPVAVVLEPLSCASLRGFLEHNLPMIKTISLKRRTRTMLTTRGQVMAADQMSLLMPSTMPVWGFLIRINGDPGFLSDFAAAFNCIEKYFDLFAVH